MATTPKPPITTKPVKPTNRTSLKKALLDECKRLVKSQIATAHEAMTAAQEGANNEDGTLGDKFESFREQMQQERDLYANQLAEANNALELLNKVEIDKAYAEISLGSIVITDEQKLFVAASLGKLILPDRQGTWFAISTQSPLFKALVGKKTGQDYNFRGKPGQVIEVA